MENIRINQMIRWYHNGNDLDIYVESKKITIPFQDSLNKLFTDFFEKFSSISIDEIISDYKIPKKLILLFIKLNIFISIDNCDWPEAKLFHDIAKNPSKTLLMEQMDEKYVAKIYENISWYFYDSLWGFSHKIYRFKSINLDNKISLKYTNSSRRETKSNTIKDKKTEILSLTKYIFSFNWESHLYWSAWWFYNIYPILIFNDDSSFCFDKYKKCFYTWINKWIFKKISECFIPSDFNDFSRYQSYIIFLSCYKWVLSKYGNRWYKYIQMEAWAIATLFRQWCANLWIGQVEIQWYFDDKMFDIISNLGIHKDKTLLIHSMCLN